LWPTSHRVLQPLSGVYVPCCYGGVVSPETPSLARRFDLRRSSKEGHHNVLLKTVKTPKSKPPDSAPPNLTQGASGSWGKEKTEREGNTRESSQPRKEEMGLTSMARNLSDSDSQEAVEPKSRPCLIVGRTLSVV
ncbi:hypothetical protein KCU93_g376, partial [Aureobasidium melanogenum]